MAASVAPARAAPARGRLRRRRPTTGTRPVCGTFSAAPNTAGTVAVLANTAGTVTADSNTAGAVAVVPNTAGTAAVVPNVTGTVRVELCCDGGACVATSSVLYIGGTHNVKFEDVTGDGTPLNSGTCTWSLKTAAGVVVGSGSLAYVAASAGDYAAVIGAAVTALLVEGRTYSLDLAFSQTSTYVDPRHLEFFAQRRGAA